MNRDIYYEQDIKFTGMKNRKFNIPQENEELLFVLHFTNNEMGFIMRGHLKDTHPSTRIQIVKHFNQTVTRPIV